MSVTQEKVKAITSAIEDALPFACMDIKHDNTRCSKWCEPDQQCFCEELYIIKKYIKVEEE